MMWCRVSSRGTVVRTGVRADGSGGNVDVGACVDEIVVEVGSGVDGVVDGITRSYGMGTSKLKRESNGWLNRKLLAEVPAVLTVSARNALIFDVRLSDRHGENI